VRRRWAIASSSSVSKSEISSEISTRMASQASIVGIVEISRHQRPQSQAWSSRGPSRDRRAGRQPGSSTTRVHGRSISGHDGGRSVGDKAEWGDVDAPLPCPTLQAGLFSSGPVEVACGSATCYGSATSGGSASFCGSELAVAFISSISAPPRGVSIMTDVPQF
jgi:hypothetical protein